MVQGNTIILIAFSLAILAISITIHEFLHGYVAFLLGDDTAQRDGRLSLNPIHHIDPFATVLLPIILVLLGLPPFGAAKPVPVNFARLKYEEFGGALVGLVGPLSNLVLAIIGGFVLGSTSPTGLWELWWSLFVAINVGFFVFNMIPFPPLDGSRVLYAFAPEPLQRFMEQIERFGLGAILIFMLVLFPLLSPTLQSINSSIIRFVTG
jgi:Zn-dependent protease